MQLGERVFSLQFMLWGSHLRVKEWSDVLSGTVVVADFEETLLEIIRLSVSFGDAELYL
jgi:hypothetical protein